MLGDEVADQVRAILPEVPALFMSGYAEPVLHRQGVAAGRMEILEKPFTEAALLARVRAAIRRQGQPAQPPAAGHPIGRVAQLPVSCR